MKKLKFGNHDEVLNFGKKLIDENAYSIGKFSFSGELTTRNSIMTGIEIITRLGDKNTRDKYSNTLEFFIDNAMINLDNKKVDMHEHDYNMSLNEINIIKECFNNSNMHNVNNGY